MKCVNEHRITSLSCAAGCGWLCPGDDTGLLAQMAVVQGSKRPNIGKTKTIHNSPIYNDCQPQLAQFGHGHENGLIKQIQTIPYNLCVSFQLASF